MDRLRDLLTPERSAILRNSTFVVLTNVSTAGLGFFFWWLAARRFSPSEVGLAATAVSAMTLLGFFGTLGLGTLLIREVSRTGRRTVAYIATAMLISGAAGALLGVIVLLIAS